MRSQLPAYLELFLLREVQHSTHALEALGGRLAQQLRGSLVPGEPVSATLRDEEVRLIKLAPRPVLTLRAGVRVRSGATGDQGGSAGGLRANRR